MAVKPSPQITVTSSGSQHLNVVAESDASGGSDAFVAVYGQTMVVVTSGPLHFGGTSGVTNSSTNRGALLPAGVWSFPLSGSDDLYAIAPAGQTVTVEVLQLGV